MNYRNTLDALELFEMSARRAREDLFAPLDDADGWYAYETLGDLIQLLEMARERCRRLYNSGRGDA